MVSSRMILNIFIPLETWLKLKFYLATGSSLNNYQLIWNMSTILIILYVMSISNTIYFQT